MIRIIPFLWGFFEATIFFLVPDVYLTGVVLKAGLKKTLVAFSYCLVGALLGGALVYYFAFMYPLKTLNWFDHIPGISVKLIQDVRVSIAANGLLSMFKGMFQGIPYKLFAAAWGEKGGNLPFFLLLSLVVRGSRFVVSIAATAFLKALSKKFFKNWNVWQWVIFCIFWLTFYIFYFNHYKL